MLGAQFTREHAPSPPVSFICQRCQLVLGSLLGCNVFRDPWMFARAAAAAWACAGVGGGPRLLAPCRSGSGSGSGEREGEAEAEGEREASGAGAGAAASAGAWGIAEGAALFSCCFTTSALFWCCFTAASWASAAEGGRARRSGWGSGLTQCTHQWYKNVVSKRI